MLSGLAGGKDDLETEDAGALGKALGALGNDDALGSKGKVEAGGVETGKARRSDRATNGGAGRANGFGTGNGAGGVGTSCD